MKKLGTFNGVFVPSFEAILGAVLFLLLPHLVGEIGLLQMLGVILIANAITTATAFSIGDCAGSTATIGAGGMYALSKSSLGKAFGGSIGIQLFLAQSASIGFYAVGFATPLQELLLSLPGVADAVAGFGLSPLEQKQVLASGLALVGLAAALIGADFVVKIQFFIFVTLLASLAGFFLAPALGIELAGKPLFSGTMNLTGAGASYGFFVALTTFFPAVTGIDAGVGMSGLLANPRRSIVRGTFFAIGITFVIYLGISVLVSFIEPALLVTTPDGLIPSTTALFSGNRSLYLILMTGIMVATASSALSYFITAPRTAQAITRDRILPRRLNFLKRDFTKRGREPRFATLLTAVIVVAVIWSGDVNVSSRVVGIAFLVVYGWINLAAFFERVSGNPSFRPSQRVPVVIGLAGFLGSMVIIAMDNLLIGMVVIASQLAIFFLIVKYKTAGRVEGVWWGLLFTIINWGFRKLRRIIQGTKNWRPILAVFVFADKPETALPTLRLADRIARFKGMVAINAFPGKSARAGNQTPLPPETSILETGNTDPSDLIPAISRMSLPSGMRFNSVLIAADARFDTTDMLATLQVQGQNLLLYKDGKVAGEGTGRIDVWWKGEMNGNLMALLAYIMAESDILQGDVPATVRLIRKIGGQETRETAAEEMDDLVARNNLKATVLLLEADNHPFMESLQKNSSDASLILMGLPADSPGSFGKVFGVHELLFKRRLGKFSELPPILFVQAAQVMQLMEE